MGERDGRGLVVHRHSSDDTTGSKLVFASSAGLDFQIIPRILYDPRSEAPKCRGLLTTIE